MAKRHSHYNSRGKPHGRGGSRSRGNRRKRGGRQGGSGRVNANNWHNSGLPMGDGDLSNPEMVDVSQTGSRRSFVSPDSVADYYFSRNGNEKSMKVGGLRPGHRNYSANDLSSGGRSTFRSRPMEFIRAKEVYDPSHDLIEELRKKNGQASISEKIEDEIKDISPESAFNTAENSLHTEEDAAELKNEDLFYVDVTGAQSSDDLVVEEVVVNETAPASERAPDVEFNSTLTIGKTEIPTKEASDGFSVDIDVDASTRPVRQYIVNVLGNIQPASDESGEEGSIKSWREPSPSVSEPSHSASPLLSSNLETLKIEEAGPPSKDEVYGPDLDDSEPEFGFLEEDYLVDLSDIHVTNIRIGASDSSYFVRCFNMFADHEFRWISQELFNDFILQERGFPGHRYEAYLKFIKASVIPPEDPPTPTYSDVPLSDDSEEDTEPFSTRDDSVGSDMREGLDDLIAYSEKYSESRNQQFKTSSLETTGKGRKKKLLIDESLGLDLESIATLQDKLSNRVGNKANKRRRKEDFIDMENKNSNDLTKKYPAGLHVHNIKDEFEQFLVSNRDRLAFPALDPHGNRTVAKFAQHYNMKSSKIGSANHTQVLAQKTNKTHRSFPNYNLIDQLLKQRPIFMRIDVSQPKDASVSVKATTRVRFNTTEGQVIGKDAPEIGCDNVGRRILEKLGWTSGEGLGAHGNKGISEPLMATVKKSKSGLRHDKKRGTTV